MKSVAFVFAVAFAVMAILATVKLRGQQATLKEGKHVRCYSGGAIILEGTEEFISSTLWIVHSGGKKYLVNASCIAEDTK